MSEQAQPSPEQEVAAPQTLDDVISEFKVEAPQVSQEAQPAQEQTPAQPLQSIDPYDETQLNNFANQTYKTQQELQKELQNLKADAESQRQAEAQKVIDRDIKKAVDTITEKVEGLDPDMAELWLEKRARENEGFKNIWLNRATNEKAYTSALNAIANELNGKFDFKADPQLAENHRAAQSSLQSNNAPPSTSFNNSLEEKLASAANEKERKLIWQKIKDGG